MVKVILTGATGFVGQAVTRYCLSRPDITSIVVISRRPLPKTLIENEKISVIIHENFMSYPDVVLKALEGAVACLWMLGLRGAPLGYKDLSYAKEVDVKYPVAAATAFSQRISATIQDGRPFRFVLLSGIGAELDQSKSFWIMHDTNLLKGRVEQKLHELAVGKSGFEVYTCRPFGILEEAPSFFKSLVFSLLPSVKAVELAAAMVELGLQGSDRWIWENAEIKQMGVSILQSSP